MQAALRHPPRRIGQFLRSRAPLELAQEVLSVFFPLLSTYLVIATATHLR